MQNEILVDYCPGCGKKARLPIYFHNAAQTLRVCGVVCWGEHFAAIFGGLHDLRVGVTGMKGGHLLFEFTGDDFARAERDRREKQAAMSGHVKQSTTFAGYGGKICDKCFTGSDTHDIACPNQARDRCKNCGRPAGYSHIDSCPEGAFVGPECFGGEDFPFEPGTESRRIRDHADGEGSAELFTAGNMPIEVAKSLAEKKLRGYESQRVSYSVRPRTSYPIPEGYAMLDNEERIRVGDMFYYPMPPGGGPGRFDLVSAWAIGQPAGRYICAIRAIEHAEPTEPAPTHIDIPAEAFVKIPLATFEAMRAVADAWNDPGRLPDIHAHLFSTWRTLANAVEKLADLNRSRE